MRNTALLLGAVFGWVIGSAVQAAPVGDLPMPDLLVLVPGAELPPGVDRPEVPCLIIEETDSRVRVDLSSFRGIRQVIDVPRASVQRLERGDPGIRPWFEIFKPLVWPAHSRKLAYYEEPVKVMQSFLERFPQSSQKAVAEREWKRWSEEAGRVRQGHFRVRDRWFQPSELDETDRAAWAFWQTLPGDQAPSSLENWAKLAADVEGHRASRFYPAVIEEMQRVTGLRRLQFPEAFQQGKPDEQLLKNNLAPLWLAWDALDRWEKAQGEGLPEREDFLNNLQKARGFWPELRWIDTLLAASLGRLRADVDKFRDEGRWQEAKSLLDAWGKSTDLFSKNEDRSSWTLWFRSAFQQIASAQTLSSMEEWLKAGEWEKVEPALRELLAQPGVADGSIHARLLEIRQQLAEHQAGLAEAELVACVEKRIYDELLAKCRDRRSKMEAQPGESGVARQRQSELLVDAAKQALHEVRLWTAWKLVMEAWRTQPGNLKAQLAVTLGAAGGFLLLLLGALPVLLVYAWLSNRIDLDFFRRRLKMAREEEERQQRRLRELGQKEEPRS